jgi:hypothetical protein
VAADPSGKFAYVTSDGVRAYTIDSATGALTSIPGSPFPAGFGPASVAVDPGSRFAYVTNSQTMFGNNVSGYTINPTSGALTPIPGSPFFSGTGPRSVAVDPSSRFVYVVNTGRFFPATEANVSGFTINTVTGALTHIPGSPFRAGLAPSSVAVTGCTITAVSTVPATLWPPNHQLVDVSVNYELSAACGEPASCTLSVASNQPVNNDHTFPDWVVLDAHHVELRAERSGAGTGRIYIITIGCTDAQGKSATQNTLVTVPHDQRH